MKALTLHHPWASLVARGLKRMETRSWGTNYRGLLAIHASRDFGYLTSNPTAVFAPYFNESELRQCMATLGCIVAIVDLLEIQPTVDVRANLEFVCENFDLSHPYHKQAERELEFGDYARGRFAWRLHLVCEIPGLLRCRGRQRLWNVPPGIESEIHNQGLIPERIHSGDWKTRLAEGL